MSSIEVHEGKARKKGPTIEVALEKLDTLAGRITYFRMARGLTQKGLAEAIGKSRASVIQYEQGRLHPPLDVIEKLAGALEVSAPYLAFGMEVEGSWVAPVEGVSAVKIENVPMRRYPFNVLTHAEWAEDGVLTGPSFFIPEADNPTVLIKAAERLYIRERKRFVTERVYGPAPWDLEKMVIGVQVWLAPPAYFKPVVRAEIEEAFHPLARFPFGLLTPSTIDDSGFAVGPSLFIPAEEGPNKIIHQARRAFPDVQFLRAHMKGPSVDDPDKLVDGVRVWVAPEGYDLHGKKNHNDDLADM